VSSTILITGAAGFIGSNLSKRLLEENHKVIGIDNLSYGSKANIHSILNNKNFTFIEADLKEENVLNDLRADVIVHLASQKIPRYTSAYITLADNSKMTNAVIKKCLRDKIKLLYASTSDIYGKNPNIPYHEKSDILLGATTVKRWAYAISKIYGEQYIIACNEEFGLEFSIMRFFGSYGINQNLTWWGGPQSVFIANALKKQPLEIHGDGLQTRTFTYIDDTVDGIIRCIFHENSKNEIFNIANEPTEEITILDLGKLIWAMVNGEQSTSLINLIPYKTFGNYEDVRRRVPDITKIKTQLGFSPKVSMREGLKRTIEWQTKISQ
jgi:UDP-glucose 4-epimerase